MWCGNRFARRKLPFKRQRRRTSFSETRWMMMLIISGPNSACAYSPCRSVEIKPSLLSRRSLRGRIPVIESPKRNVREEQSGFHRPLLGGGRRYHIDGGIELIFLPSAWFLLGAFVLQVWSCLPVSRGNVATNPWSKGVWCIPAYVGSFRSCYINSGFTFYGALPV